MEFLVPGPFDEYKSCMIKAAMKRIELNLKKKLKRFKLEFTQDFFFCITVPIYDFDSDCIFINKGVVRCKKGRMTHEYANLKMKG